MGLTPHNPFSLIFSKHKVIRIYDDLHPIDFGVIDPIDIWPNTTQPL